MCSSVSKNVAERMSQEERLSTTKPALGFSISCSPLSTMKMKSHQTKSEIINIKNMVCIFFYKFYVSNSDVTQLRMSQVCSGVLKNKLQSIKTL